MIFDVNAGTTILHRGWLGYFLGNILSGMLHDKSVLLFRVLSVILLSTHFVLAFVVSRFLGSDKLQASITTLAVSILMTSRFEYIYGYDVVWSGFIAVSMIILVLSLKSQSVRLLVISGLLLGFSVHAKMTGVVAIPCVVAIIWVLSKQKVVLPAATLKFTIATIAGILAGFAITWAIGIQMVWDSLAREIMDALFGSSDHHSASAIVAALRRDLVWLIIVFGVLWLVESVAVLAYRSRPKWMTYACVALFAVSLINEKWVYMFNYTTVTTAVLSYFAFSNYRSVVGNARIAPGIVLFLGVAMLFSSIFGSNTGMYKSIFSWSLFVPLVYFVAPERYAVELGSCNPGKRVIPIIVCVAVFVRLFWVYGDNNQRTLTTVPVLCGPFAGLYTTSSRASMLKQLDTYVRVHITSNTKVLSDGGMGAAAYLYPYVTPVAMELWSGWMPENRVREIFDDVTVLKFTREGNPDNPDEDSCFCITTTAFDSTANVVRFFSR